MKRRTGSTPELSHVEDTFLPDGRRISEGDEFTLYGGGRYRFLYEYLGDGSFAAYGPIGSDRAKLRAFRPDRIRTVHRSRKARP